MNSSNGILSSWFAIPNTSERIQCGAGGPDNPSRPSLSIARHLFTLSGVEGSLSSSSPLNDLHTLPSSVSRKSCIACPPWRATLTKTAGCIPTIPILVHPERLLRRERARPSVPRSAREVLPWGMRSLQFFLWPPIVTSLPPYIVASRSRWTSSPWQAIISLRRHHRLWRPSPRRGNEHFSKRTESAGVLSLRICGHTALDRAFIWRGDRRSGRSWLRRLFHANPAEPGSCQAAGPEQNSHRAARSGQLAPRRPERPPRGHRAESRHDPGGNFQGPEPRRIHSQGAADRRPETHRATHASAEGKRGKTGSRGHRSRRRQKRHRSHQERSGSHENQNGQRHGRHERDERPHRPQPRRPRRTQAPRRSQLLRILNPEIQSAAARRPRAGHAQQNRSQKIQVHRDRRRRRQNHRKERQNFRRTRSILRRPLARHAVRIRGLRRRQKSDHRLSLHAERSRRRPRGRSSRRHRNAQQALIVSIANYFSSAALFRVLETRRATGLLAFAPPRLHRSV